MTTLTKAEEEIMQIIWRLERCTVSDVRDSIEQTEGLTVPHSTISTSASDSASVMRSPST